MRIANLLSAVRVRGLLVVLAILTVSLAPAAGCSLGSDQDQALEEQKQKNEELQKQLDKQKKEEAQRKKKEEEAQQKELEQQVKDLQEKVEKQEKEQDQASGSSGDSSDSAIENASTSPSQAPEGVVVVSSDFNTAAASAEEAEVINAAIDYYQYAEVGDYDTTYNLLSYEDQNYYTRDEWIASNTALDSAAGEFVVTDAYPDDIGLGVPTYAVTLTVYMTDGSSFNRTTYFVNEGGYWAHYLNDEEVNMFDDALY
jgi:Sec-independent protein translocase protein TatA